MVIEPPYSEPLNFTLSVYDPYNSTQANNLTFFVDIDESCIRLPPSMMITPEGGSIPSGKPSTVVFLVNVTNNDVGGENCTTSDFSFGARAPSPTSGWRFYGNPVTIVDLGSGETDSSYITVISRENIEPGDYPITLSLQVGNRVFHSNSSRTTISVNCPTPRPVTNVVADVISPFFSFGLQAGPVFLSWDGCLSGLWCCCPCQ